MKLSFYFNYFVLIVLSVKAKLALCAPTDYASLISRVNEFYSSSTVIFAHPADNYGDYGDLHVTHFVHTWSRILNRADVVTLNVHFGSMYKVKRYFRTIVKPLMVVLIPNLQALFEFSNATKTFKMSFPTWLVIFLQTPTNEEHNYCHEPVGNPFHLAFNTVMLVSCHDDDILREWYSVDTYTTEIFELATYDPLRGIVLHTDLSLYDRRKDLKGTILRAVTTKDSIFFRVKNEEFTGFFGSIFKELTRTLNFTLQIVSETIEYGSFNYTTEAWSGAIAQMISGQADIGVSDFSMTSDRLNAVDYMVPLLVSQNCLYIKEPEILDGQWSAYFKVFSATIWLSIIAIIVIFPVIVILIKKYSGTVNKGRTISEEFLQVWGIFCQQGLTEFPESSWLRVTYFTLFTTAIVTFAAYSASLICFLTARIPILPFFSLNEFVENGSYDVLITPGSADYDIFANSKDPVAVAMMKLLRPYDTLPKDVQHSYQSICTDSRLALYTSEELRKWLGSLIPCKVSIINAGRIDSLSVILSKDSPYTSCLNQHVQTFWSTGLLDRFKHSSYAVKYDREITFQAVDIFNVLTVLVIFAGGVFSSIVILILETLYYNYTNYVQSSNVLNAQEWTGFEFVV